MKINYVKYVKKNIQLFLQYNQPYFIQLIQKSHDQKD